MLQDLLMHYLIMKKSRVITSTNKRPLKSLSDMLKGKQEDQTKFTRQKRLFGQVSNVVGPI